MGSEMCIRDSTNCLQVAIKTHSFRAALVEKHRRLIQKMIDLEDDIEDDLEEAGQPLLVPESSMIPTMVCGTWTTPTMTPWNPIRFYYT